MRRVSRLMLELMVSDESTTYGHENATASFAMSCCMYTAILRPVTHLVVSYEVAKRSERFRPLSRFSHFLRSFDAPPARRHAVSTHGTRRCDDNDAATCARTVGVGDRAYAPSTVVGR
jgi:hypothetical protein